MNSRVRTGLLIIIGGFFLLAGGVYFALRIIGPNVIGITSEAPPTPEPEVMMQAIFAARDLPMGTVISAEDIKVAEFPIRFAPQDVIAGPEGAVGKISKMDLVEGELLLGHNLVDPTNVSAYDVAYILDDNHVLMAMPATDLMSREAVIKRGDIVDMMVSIQETLETVNAEGETTEGETQPEETKPQQVTFTVSQRLGISAIIVDIVEDPNSETPQEKPDQSQVVVQAYLIALNPQDALVVKYLKDIGGIFEFVIRAPTSTGQFDLTPVTSEFIKELYGLDLLP
ncbi:MAG: hypothetical protein RL275_2972 [Chloroflexota bacterium]